MKRSGRPLTQDDISIWNSLAATVDKRLYHENIKEQKPLEKSTTISKSQPGSKYIIPVKTECYTKPKTSMVAKLSEKGSGVDRRTARRLRRGDTKPAARLDLHGYTEAHAHTALIRFIQRHAGLGSRWVLVITGKGQKNTKNQPFSMGERERGILHRVVPVWLRQPPITYMVTNIIEAGPAFGGEGALIVYLRKK